MFDDPSEVDREIRAHDVAIAALDAEIQAVNDGTHPEFLRRCKRLQQAKDQREARAKKAYDHSIKTLERLHDLEMDDAKKQLDRGVELVREKQEFSKDRRNSDTAVTRSLRSKATDDDKVPRRQNRRGAQSPASMLLDKGLSDSVMQQDFHRIDQQVAKRQRTQQQQQ